MANLSSDVNTQGDANGVAPVVNKVEQVSIEDLRKLQAKKDKEIERIRAEAEARRKRLEQLEESLADPDTRAKLQRERIEQELSHYRQRDSVYEAKKNWAAEFGVDPAAMEDADTIEEVGIAAISWFKSKIEGLSKQVKETTRQEEVAGLEAGGGLDVNINSGPAGGSVTVNDIDKKYAEDARKLRKSTFEDWYKAGYSAGKGGVRPKV